MIVCVYTTAILDDGADCFHKYVEKINKLFHNGTNVKYHYGHVCNLIK